MAIYVTTGTPGAGKTLRTLYKVEALRKQSGRDVYYNGINDLMLPWIEFDNPKEWHKLPDNSIIVIDEAQRAFRPRAASTAVPEYVEALETHRHRGIDIYLVTQHPLMLEQNVRRLTESHEHLMRKFGSKWATVHQWKGIKENCDKSRSDSQSSEFVYPKDVFTWYKSAQSHTHKFKLPFKVKVLLSLPFIIAAGLYYAYYSSTKLSAKPLSQPLQSSISQSTTAPNNVATSGSRGGRGDIRSPRALEAYVAEYEPRFAGLPWTAPRYDDLTQPKVVPVIRGCMILGDETKTDLPRAWCILDGGVRVYPPISFIKNYIRDAYFIDFEQTGRAGDYAASQPRDGDKAIGNLRPPVPSTGPLTTFPAGTGL
jgi:zona occludens toxin